MATNARIMKISEAKSLTPEVFVELDAAYSGFEKEHTKRIIT